MLITFINGLSLMAYKRDVENREDHWQDSWCGQLSQVLTFFQYVVFGASTKRAQCSHKVARERH
ncbi:hypothetical protein [Cobetia sp. L2A1]|uniref:hypothetical protein n=1 Tax=Cobetia sp. L2A1 TaxID=2686360 RepID=UPI00131E69D3|nr:hypothetical protein [Cobetia sp. L2A1]